MLSTLTHEELDTFSVPMLKRRVRVAKEDVVDAAVRAAYGEPDFPSARATLEQAVFLYQDASAALDRKSRVGR